jgi:hypothetical protein
MDRLDEKELLLDSIRSSEGAEFVCDDKAILDEYKKQSDNQSSLTIKVLSIFGSLLASLAFLGFLIIAGLHESEWGLTIVGTGFILLAVLLNKNYDKLVVDTFRISTYIMGVVMLAFGLLEMDIDEDSVAIFLSLIALGSLARTTNYILSFVSVLVMSTSFLYIIVMNEFANLIHLYIALYTFALAYMLLREAKIISLSKKLSKLYNPIRIGLLFSLLVGLTFIGSREASPFSQNHVWLSSITMILVLLYLVHTIVNINDIQSVRSKGLIYALSAVILLSTWFAPAVSGAIIIILLSFLVNYKTGFVIGVIAFIYFISQYYYDLSFTLLTKSMLLLSSGFVFVLFYFLTLKLTHTDEEV